MAPSIGEILRKHGGFILMGVGATGIVWGVANYQSEPSICRSAVTASNQEGPLLCIRVPLDKLADQGLDHLGSYYGTHAFVTEGFVQPLESDNTGSSLSMRYALFVREDRTGQGVILIDNSGVMPLKGKMEIVGKITATTQTGVLELELLAAKKIEEKPPLFPRQGKVQA